MKTYNIQGYNDFITALSEAGFSMGGGNAEGIFAVINWGWNEESDYTTNVKWHTEDRETDPWEWRMRVLDERNDIAYGKVFFKKSGYITQKWYPYFLAVRRENLSFDEMYESGHISYAAKRIYDVIHENGAVALHDIKTLTEFSKEEKSLFDRALVELQMKLFITICGRRQKISQKDTEHGWSSTVLCTIETFWGDEVFKQAALISRKEAVERIREQVLTLNPHADEKKILKFING